MKLYTIPDFSQNTNQPTLGGEGMDFSETSPIASYIHAAMANAIFLGFTLEQVVQSLYNTDATAGYSYDEILQTAQAIVTPQELADLLPVVPKPGTIKALSQDDSHVLAVHSGSATIEIPGYIVPASPAAIKAGTMALANKLALDLQNGLITQATFDAAIAALQPTPQ